MRMLPALLIGLAPFAALAQAVPPAPAGSVAAPAASVTPPLSIDERLARVERLLQSQTLVDLATRMEELHREIQELRGQVEVLGHDLNGVRDRQRDLYVDTDRRLRRIEAQPVAASATDPAVAPPASPAVPPVASLAVPAPTPATPPTAARAPTAPPSEQEEAAYQKAFGRLKDGQYAAAIQEFQAFLGKYPRGTYADNARYWLGESFYVSRNFPAAIEQFRKVGDDHPASPKVPDSMLKIGYAQYELGDWGKARAALEAVRDKHPNSTAARLAANRLERMQREGR